MIPLFILAIEDDADRVFMINLYEQCQKAMYYQALDILHDHGEAEDAVHDALIKLMDRISALRTLPKSQILPYAIASTRQRQSIAGAVGARCALAQMIAYQMTGAAPRRSTKKPSSTWSGSIF